MNESDMPPMEDDEDDPWAQLQQEWWEAEDADEYFINAACAASEQKVTHGDHRD